MNRIAVAKELIAVAGMMTRHPTAGGWQDERAKDAERARDQINRIIDNVKEVKGWKANSHGMVLFFNSPKDKDVQFSATMYHEGVRLPIKFMFYFYGQRSGYEKGWQPLWDESFAVPFDGTTPKELEQVIEKNWSKIMAGVAKAKKLVDHDWKVKEAAEQVRKYILSQDLTVEEVKAKL